MGQPSDLLPPDALSSAFSALWRLFWGQKRRYRA